MQIRDCVCAVDGVHEMASVGQLLACAYLVSSNSTVTLSPLPSYVSYKRYTYTLQLKAITPAVHTAMSDVKHSMCGVCA